MTEEEISEWAKKLVHRYDNIKIVGAGGEWSGDSRQGFMFNPITKAPTTTSVPPGSGACCFDDGTCVVETAAQCGIDGGTYQGDGTSCTPNPCPTHTGACCFDDGTCSVISHTLCDSSGGDYQGDGTTCDPNPCPQPPTGACCVGSECTVENEDTCVDSGGTYQGDGTTCSPNPCPSGATGACCSIGMMGSECNVETQAACNAAGGYYFGDGTTCMGIDCGGGACDGVDHTATTGCRTPSIPSCVDMTCYSCCLSDIYAGVTKVCLQCVDSGAFVACGDLVQCFTGFGCVSLTAEECANELGGASIYCSCPV